MPEDNFFTNLLRKIYNVEISENPDYLFYSVYPETKEGKDLSKKGELIKKISPPLYIFLRRTYSKIVNRGKKSELVLPKGDYVKIFYGSEHVMPNMDECDWAFSSYFDEDINHPKHLRIPMYRMNDYKLKFRKEVPVQV